jgi:hypothetical protein
MKYENKYPIVVLFILLVALIVNPSIPLSIALVSITGFCAYRAYLDHISIPDYRKDFDVEISRLQDLIAQVNHKTNSEIQDLKTDIVKNAFKKGPQNETFRF